MEEHLQYLKRIVENGGPQHEEFEQLSEHINQFAAKIKSSDNADEILSSVRHTLGDALSKETIQGYGYQKPYGYSGDFFMIDKIYTQHTSSHKDLEKWDVFFHNQKAPIAVRNRKDYFLNLLMRLRDQVGAKELHILNIASGPARDVLEYLEKTQDQHIHFHCVEYDQHAIDYAKELCKNYMDQITFYKKNALRFCSNRKFDLVWSAGLLDYFNDKQFVFLLKRMCTLAADHAEIVVGNFHPDNPSRDYMELVGDWYLTYRTECDLMTLAQKAGFCLNDIRVGVEKENVNLFLHIKSEKQFV